MTPIETMQALLEELEGYADPVNRTDVVRLNKVFAAGRTLLAQMQQSEQVDVEYINGYELLSKR